jgi:hypothetical protein
MRPAASECRPPPDRHPRRRPRSWQICFAWSPPCLPGTSTIHGPSRRLGQVCRPSRLRWTARQVAGHSGALLITIAAGTTAGWIGGAAASPCCKT